MRPCKIKFKMWMDGQPLFKEKADNTKSMKKKIDSLWEKFK